MSLALSKELLLDRLLVWKQIKEVIFAAPRLATLLTDTVAVSAEVQVLCKEN